MVPIVAVEGLYSDRVRVEGKVNLGFNSLHATLGIDGSQNPEALEQLERLIANWERDADGNASLVVTTDEEENLSVNGGSAKSYDYAIKRGEIPANAVRVRDTSSST